MGPSTAILGLSAFYQDSAACLVVDGEIVGFDDKREQPAWVDERDRRSEFQLD